MDCSASVSICLCRAQAESAICNRRCSTAGIAGRAVAVDNGSADVIRCWPDTPRSWMARALAGSWGYPGNVF